MCVNFVNCICVNENKVPQTEQSILADQRGPRRVFIGSIDRKKIGEIEKKKKRKTYLISLAQPSLTSSTTIEIIREDTDKSPLQLNTNDEGENTDASDDYEYQPPRTSMKKICSQTVKYIQKSPENVNRRKVIIRFKNPPYFAETCNRFCISAREFTVPSTSSLDDLGAISRTLLTIFLAGDYLSVVARHLITKYTFIFFQCNVTLI